MHMGANARRASFIPDFVRLAAKFVRDGHACAEKASEIDSRVKKCRLSLLEMNEGLQLMEISHLGNDWINRQKIE